MYIGAWSGQFPFEVNSASPGLVVTEWVNLSLVPEYVSVKGGDVITIVGKAFKSAIPPTMIKKAHTCVFFDQTALKRMGFLLRM